VTVSDTTPPVISSATASPNVLWPANHRLVPVMVTFALVMSIVADRQAAFPGPRRSTDTLSDVDTHPTTVVRPPR
jgi:hypothetical protein